MTREQAIGCDRTLHRHGPEPLCSFTLVRESYGILVGIVGYCTVHDGGKIVINAAIENWVQQKNASGVRDFDRVIAEVER